MSPQRQLLAAVAAEISRGGSAGPVKANDGEGAWRNARPLPRISIEAFCDDDECADTLRACSADRRLSKASLAIHMGGATAALAHYQTHPTPSLVILQSADERDVLISGLDALAESCDAETRVIVVGKLNDVVLYREMLKRGVSEYLVAPVSKLELMESISSLFADPGTAPVGHVFAFIGAKGGVGSSSVCHNTAWMLSEALRTQVVIADLDLAFGTTGLDFNQDPVQGIADALADPERLDPMLLDRLLTKCTDHLSIFAAPVVLDRDYDLSAEACEAVIDVVRGNIPYIAIDLPHVWTSWVKRLLLAADEIVITAAPDLANLRNAKSIIELLKQARPNDGAPHLVLNTVNMPKRPEIKPKEFAQSVGIEPTAVIEFDSETFGHAANNGQMIAELSKKARAIQPLRTLTRALADRKQPNAEPKRSAFAPLLGRLKRKS